MELLKTGVSQSSAKCVCIIYIYIYYILNCSDINTKLTHLNYFVYYPHFHQELCGERTMYRI